MTEINLPPDDLPPVQITPTDVALRQELEAAIARHLYEACDGVTQSILMSCEWFVTTNAVALTLVVNCPDAATHWRVLNNLTLLSNPLAWFSSIARIRVCLSSETDDPFELRVDEIAIYRDSFEIEG